MADKTAIEWTDATWNPIRARNVATGKMGWHCTHASEGCRNCYAERINIRTGASGGTGIAYKPGHLGRDVELFLDERMLERPLHWRQGRKIFPLSMTDLFGDFVPDAWIARIFNVMAETPQHIYQVLTKRADRMFSVLHGPKNHGLWSAKLWHRSVLPNVWLGTSVEDQAAADERVPLLLKTPAAIRFLSVEPMLGPIDLYNGDPDPRLGGHRATETFIGDWWEPGDDLKGPSRHGVDWVICGGESGPAARPMHPDWVRSLRDQCAAAEVPFHFKQWGEFREVTDGSEGDELVGINPQIAEHDCAFNRSAAAMMLRVGKKKAGRLLDGIEHNAFPEPAR